MASAPTAAPGSCLSFCLASLNDELLFKLILIMVFFTVMETITMTATGTKDRFSTRLFESLPDTELPNPVKQQTPLAVGSSGFHHFIGNPKYKQKQVQQAIRQAPLIHADDYWALTSAASDGKTKGFS